MNEATARLRINKLLERTGWRVFPEDAKPANVRLEANVSIKSSDLNALGSNFEEERCWTLGFHVPNQSAPLRHGYRLRAALGVIRTPTAVLPSLSP